MDHVVIEGVRPYDGRYEWDYRGAPFTTREWGWIKRNSGYLPLTLTGEALSDPEFVAVLATICLRRAGVIDTGDVADVLERLADIPAGQTITIEFGKAEAEDDADPPPLSSNGSDGSGSRSSTSISESSETPLSPTGHLASDISVSVPVTSAS